MEFMCLKLAVVKWGAATALCWPVCVCATKWNDNKQPGDFRYALKIRPFIFSVEALAE